MIFDNEEQADDVCILYRKGLDKFDHYILLEELDQIDFNSCLLCLMKLMSISGRIIALK